MIIRKAFKYQLKTSPTEEAQLRQIVGNCRFVWNKALNIQKDRLDNKEKTLSYCDLSAFLKQWRSDDETDFLAISSFDSQQQKLRDLDRAFKDFFDKSSGNGFPKFKKKGVGDSFRCVGKKQFALCGNKIRIPKVGWIGFRKSREIDGEPKNATVSLSSGKWYVSVQTEIEIGSPVHPSGKMVGVDMGVAKFATLSNGEVVEPLGSFGKLESKLAMEQRKLSRKKKFSNNWKKQKQKIQKIHSKIANARKDFLHKQSTRIANENQVVVMEDLQVSNMSKSAKGSLENPGRNVAAKSGLNKSILDQGWYEFKRQIEYKQLWRGGELILVPARYTSQMCSKCGNIDKASRVSQSRFVCVKCSHTQNADLNASLNILAAGHAVIACGDIKRIAA